VSMTLIQTWSWPWEEERSTWGCGLAMASSTVPAWDVPTSEHEGRSLTPRYEHDRAWGWDVWTPLRYALVMLY
jgi:hypothetical protein